MIKAQKHLGYEQLMRKVRARYRKSATLDEAFARLDTRVKGNAERAAMKQATALGEQYGKVWREMNSKAQALGGDMSANMKAFAAAFINALMFKPPSSSPKTTTKKKASK